MFSGRVITQFDCVQSSSLDLAAPSAPLSLTVLEQYSDGTGADQAQQSFSDTRTLSGSSSESLDLSGSLVGPLGNTLALTAVKEIFIRNKSATNQLRVGKKITNGFAGPFDQTAGALGMLVEPNGVMHVRNPGAAGWAVTASTADLLSVENLGGTSSDYDIIIIAEG